MNIGLPACFILPYTKITYPEKLSTEQTFLENVSSWLYPTLYYSYLCT